MKAEFVLISTSAPTGFVPSLMLEGEGILLKEQALTLCLLTKFDTAKVFRFILDEAVCRMDWNCGWKVLTSGDLFDKLIVDVEFGTHFL